MESDGFATSMTYELRHCIANRSMLAQRADKKIFPNVIYVARLAYLSLITSNSDGLASEWLRWPISDNIMPYTNASVAKWITHWLIYNSNVFILYFNPQRSKGSLTILHDFSFVSLMLSQSKEIAIVAVQKIRREKPDWCHLSESLEHSESHICLCPFVRHDSIGHHWWYELGINQSALTTHQLLWML